MKFRIGIKYLVIWMAVLPLMVSAQDETKSWKGFELSQFAIDGHVAYYVKPMHPLPGNPWVWRTSFPDWHTDMDSILVAKGFHLAYVNIDNQYGSPYAIQVYDKLYAYLTDKVSLSSKVALEGVSRGALYAFGWAKRNPGKVSCIYVETPVCDIKSWPGGKGKGPGDTLSWREFKQVFHFTEEQAMAYHDNPIDNLEGLASYRVPVLATIGPNDKLAPSDENIYFFAKRYLAAGGPVSIYPITKGKQELQGHHFTVDRSGYYADFIIENSTPVKQELPYNKYFKTGSGLNNFYYAAAVRKKANVAFLGGSITYNPGWRNKVCQYLRESYPGTDFHFIAAGIPSLGSLPHAFRVQRDVLDSAKVDLLFVEAAVNDRGLTAQHKSARWKELCAMQKNANPLVDIVMMAFVDPQKMEAYNKGQLTPELANHELIAKYYNLPYINLAQEVTDKIKNNELSWVDDFKDLHPSVYGQELYFATIKSLLQATTADQYAPAIAPKLPKPIDKARIEDGSYFDITNAKLDKGWAITPNWKPADGLPTREGFVNVPMLTSSVPGSEMSLLFKGNAVGLAIISGSDAGTISYAIDNGEFKEKTLYTEYSGVLHLPLYLLLGSDLNQGNHVLKIRISERKTPLSKGNACRIVHFLVNGK